MQKRSRETEDYRHKVRKQERIVARSKFHQVNRRIIAETVRKINNGQGKILEIGCGYGDITREYIAPNCALVVATDLTKRFVGKGISSNIEFQLEDALNLSFPDNTFDGVISIDTIEHVEDDVKFIEESLRVLKKGGTLFFTTPNRRRLSSVIRYLIGRPIRFPYSYASDTVLGDILHLREYSLDDLHRFLKGFAAELVEIEGIWFGIPAFQIGITRPPKLLQRYAFNWHVKLIEPSEDCE